MKKRASVEKKELEKTMLYKNDSYINILDGYPNLLYDMSEGFSGQSGQVIVKFYPKNGKVNPNKNLLLPYNLFSVSGTALLQPYHDIINVVTRKVLIDTKPKEWHNHVIGYNGIGIHFDLITAGQIIFIRKSLIGLGGNAPEWLGVAEVCNEALGTVKKQSDCNKKQYRGEDESSETEQAIRWLDNQRLSFTGGDQPRYTMANSGFVGSDIDPPRISDIESALHEDTIRRRSRPIRPPRI